MQNLGGGGRFWGVHYGLGESGEYTNFEIHTWLRGLRNKAKDIILRLSDE